MSELDEIMEGKHKIEHIHIEGDTIAFETELDSHTWNLSPRDLEIIIYCLQKENNKQKEVLDKIKDIIKDRAYWCDETEDGDIVSGKLLQDDDITEIEELLEEIE